MGARRDPPTAWRAGGVLAALLACWIGFGCSPGEPTEGARDAAPASERASSGASGSKLPRHVILISIDTLRADHLGLYGYERFTSPNLDALAGEGAVFEDASATTAWTLPSHASMLTGLFPAEHGVVSSSFALPDDVPTLAALLEQRGFTTAAVVNALWLERDLFGLTREFDNYQSVRDPDYGRRSPSTRVTDQAITWLRDAGDARLFLFVHYYDVHADYASLPANERLFVEPYEGPADGTAWQIMRFNFAEEHIRRCRAAFDPEFCSFGSSEKPRLLDESFEPVVFDAADVRHLESLYDAGVRQMDTEIGRFIAFLRESALLDETLLVITSDHGEEFLDHGRMDHFLTTYQESLRVPLILRGPGVPTGLRIADPVSSVDLVPTVLALVGGGSRGAAPDFSGVDLSPLFGGSSVPALDARWIYGEASGGLQYDDSLNGVYPIYSSARKGRYKGVYETEHRSLSLFDLSVDPGEQNDIAAREPALAAEMKSLLERRHESIVTRKPTGRAVELDPSEIEELRALGYAPD